MEVLDGYLKELQKTFDDFRKEDVKSFEEYEAKMRAAIECQIAPGMKKQRTSLEEDQDSGVDATTITQASTATSSSTAGNTRPSRSAKTAASGNLKLPKLGTKLRQEIKLERITESSTTSTHSKQSDAKENDFNSLNIKREKISLGVRSMASSNDDKDSSILVIPNEVNIITLSDDDDDNADDNNGHSDVDKMPPPMVPAPKKLPAKKTRNTHKNSASAESSASETNSSQNNEPLEPKKTRKGKKTKKPVLPMVEIKQEKDAVDDVEENAEVVGSKKTKGKKSSEKTDLEAGSKNATMESVYEDASDKIPSQPSNGLAPSATYVLPKNSAKEKGEALKVENVGKSKTSLSSILTEDNSDEEEPIIQLPKNANKQKELFNPLVQSPMKAKVAAFEKLQEFGSPAPPIRQTRTKTRQLAKQNSESSTCSASSTNSTSKLPKPTTPSVELRYPIKDSTPLGKTVGSVRTYSAQNAIRTQMSSSSTKVGSLSRPASAQPLKIRSRDNSVEDQARAREALLEKKRKADDRVKRAQMQREAQEKEKLDKMEKLMKAKQEKEAAREAAKQLKQQQEIQKQLKALEQKRERERKLKAELAEAAKLERDQMLSKKIADEKAYLDQMKQNRKEETKPTLTFDMLETDDSTDDEDTVSKNRPNRPPPPAWSLRANSKREIILQAGVSVNTIDKLFSCKPTTPDLAAIFPQIEEKHLQRNSSAFWNTPPRYSELPKY
ncbi:nucleolar and coiled-body phosphoprotein 1 [Bradysia coprophila]|uniref:nucleolar and coiled-body phosphoprotein 1 n=1 Tax=Bradysia coprophila TaxID=38358 RepID=UPI00187D7C53|nr:nucleolar and coiled-body phosphoprotein 1 [Bradysia coprophila]